MAGPVAITVNLGDLGKLEKKLGSRLNLVLRRASLSAAMRSVAYMQQRTRTAMPANPSGIGSGGAVNTGAYLRAWRTGQSPQGASVYNSSKYAGVIELGRRTGKVPPREAIARWAQRRLGLDEKDARAAAYPIARAIARRGLVGRYVMTAPEAMRKMADFFVEEFEKELDKVLSESAGR
jgi:hypothetical protein